MDGLVDGIGPVAFSGVKGAVDVIFEDKEECLAVVLGRIIRFGTGEVESNYAAVFVGDGKLSQLIADVGIDVSHAADDDAGFNAEFAFAATQALVDGIHNACKAKAIAGVENGGVAHFQVSDVFV